MALPANLLSSVPANAESANAISPDSDSTAVIREYSPERIVIEVNASSAGFLILTDAWYPGWRAAVNGAETPIYRADVMFRAVSVPAGESTVVFTYYPTNWNLALFIGVAAWLLVVLFFLTGLIIRQRHR
jgi:uncharacterized membrane protein YfhO